jgi:hypothetical protein
VQREERKALTTLQFIHSEIARSLQSLRRAAFLFALFSLHFALLSPAHSQDTSSTSPYAGYSRQNITPLRQGVAAGIVGVVGVGMVVDAYFTWWKDAEGPFSFYTDHWFNGSLRGIDKVGHFYGTYLEFKGMRDVMLWGGYSPEASFWWPAGIAAFHALEIEIGDAFSPYGFDYQDLTMGLLGVAYGMAQTRVPFLNNFNFKVSFWPAKGFTTPANFTSDYDAMTVWLTANVHNLLPSSVGEYWPEWLQIAAGYGSGWGISRREFVIGLDLNLEGFTTHNDHVLVVERVFNNLHYPAPALKLTEGKGPVGYMLHLK